MNKDYLWDKTGEDAEIERFENALAAFRYREIAPPELPAKVFALKQPRRFFGFGLAFAAFASVAAIFFAMWFQFSSGTIPVADKVAEVSELPTAGKISSDEPETAAIKIVSKTPRFSGPKMVKLRRISAPNNRANKKTARQSKVTTPNEMLTAEEKHAYDQLMIALSVTSSSLRIVKDKVAGIDEKTAVFDTAK